MSDPQEVEGWALTVGGYTSAGEVDKPCSYAPSGEWECYIVPKAQREAEREAMREALEVVTYSTFHVDPRTGQSQCIACEATWSLISGDPTHEPDCKVEEAAAKLRALPGMEKTNEG